MQNADKPFPYPLDTEPTACWVPPEEGDSRERVAYIEAATFGKGRLNVTFVDEPMFVSNTY